MVKKSVIGLLIATLTGCGFHQVTMKQQPICLKQKSALPYEMRRLLNIDCNNKKANELIIHQLAVSQSDVSSSTNNTVRQYQLTRSLSFDLLSPTHKTILKNQHIRLSKPLIIDNNAVLSSTIEMNKLTEEMEKELARRLVFLLNTATLKK